jgi:hypothetical protein
LGDAFVYSSFETFIRKTLLESKGSVRFPIHGGDLSHGVYHQFFFVPDFGCTNIIVRRFDAWASVCRDYGEGG